MEIRTKTALSGYLSRAPQLKHLSDGLPLFIAQLGQKQYRSENDGTLTLLGTEYVKLVMFGEAAEAAFSDFVAGDDVVAVGEFKTRLYEHRGESIEERQFQAGKLIFDTTRHRYQVERSPRTGTKVQQNNPRATAAAAEFRVPKSDSTVGIGR